MYQRRAYGRTWANISRIMSLTLSSFYCRKMIFCGRTNMVSVWVQCAAICSNDLYRRRCRLATTMSYTAWTSKPLNWTSRCSITSTIIFCRGVRQVEILIRSSTPEDPPSAAVSRKRLTHSAFDAHSCVGLRITLLQSKPEEATPHSPLQVPTASLPCDTRDGNFSGESLGDHFRMVQSRSRNLRST